MAFTQVTLTGAFQTPAGGAAAGQLTFTPTVPMSNGGVTVAAAPTVVTLTNGAFSVTLPAVDDPLTVPQGVCWGVTEEITGGQPRDYFIILSASDAPTVDLSTLTPGQGGWL